MKSIMNTLYQLLEDFGRIRAATHFARMGDHASAKAILAAK